MNIKKMEVFRAVMASRSISGAAKVLQKSPPSVSQTISALEEEVGFELFGREKRKLNPTKEAFYFLNEVEEVFSRIQDLSQTIGDIQNKQQGFLRVGCMLGPSVSFMPELVADFMELYPESRVSLQTRPSNILKGWVASGQYDIGLMDISDWDPAIETELYTLSCLCALPANHHLAKHSILTPDLLHNEPMISLYEEHMTHKALLHLFDITGNHLNVRVRTRFFAPALEMVEREMGVCVLDPISAESYCMMKQPGKIVFRKFAPHVPFSFWILFPANKPKKEQTEAFARMLRSRIENIAFCGPK